MNAQYPSGWSYRTAPGNGTDIGPALSVGIAALRGGPGGTGRGRIVIDAGHWQLSTPGIDFSGIQLEGLGSQASVVWFNSVGGAAFTYSGAGGYSGGGMRGLSIWLETGIGSSNAYPVLLRGNSASQPDQSLFEDLYITAGSGDYWYDGFHADGTSRTSPQGIRIVCLRDIQIFRCRNTTFYLANVVGWSIENVGCYVGATNSALDFYVTGNGMPLTNSTQVSISRLNCGGTLHLTNCSEVYAEGLAGGLVTGGTNLFTSNLVI